MNNKISFVLPTTRKDFDIAKFSIFSILELFNRLDIDKFYIIVPNSDLHYGKVYFEEYKPYCTLINEDILNISNKVHGWHKQQVIKLNICKHISTEFYIVLDSDCYLTKKIALADIYRDNKPIVALIHKHRNDWLLKSCIYFNIDYDKGCPANVMNVTPQILKTSIVLEVIEKHNVENLIIQGCNEFWIYFCYILKHYNFEQIYNVDIHNQLASGGCWHKENMEHMDIEKFIKNQFDNKETIFTLFQSNMGINRSSYLPILYKCIDEAK
jgi:hypothetical protein